MLKSKEKRNHYKEETISIVNANQAVTFRNISDRNNPVVYNFKVLTMSNNLVREEYSFTFQQIGADDPDQKNKQMLVISRDLNKLMEVYGDSKCKIFTKK